MTNKHPQQEQAIKYVCDFYQISREECVECYWDEVLAALRLMDKGVV